MARLLGRTMMPLSHLGNNGHILYNYMANTLTYSYLLAETVYLNVAFELYTEVCLLPWIPGRMIMPISQLGNYSPLLQQHKANLFYFPYRRQKQGISYSIGKRVEVKTYKKERPFVLYYLHTLYCSQLAF